MRREIRQYVESELRYYHETKQEFEMLREDIIRTGGDSTQERIGGFTCMVTKPTEDAAIQLVTSKRLRHMETVLMAIERTLSRLNEHELRLVELMYWDNRYRPEGVAQQLNCDKRTVYRWRDRICKAVACEMGLLQ
jgi:RinA family phage transcriptional activator